jgi:hypothetical protein
MVSNICWTAVSSNTNRIFLVSLQLSQPAEYLLQRRVLSFENLQSLTLKQRL